MNAASRLVRAPLDTTARLSETQLSASRKWLDRLRRSDAEFILAALKRVVAQHPLVRKGMSGSGFVTGAGMADLVQDLYLELLRKGRFGHYLAKEMTDLQIEREILNLELSNILTGRLRKERPEHYRLARRMAEILEADPRFKRFGAGGERDCRIPERLYGLATWDPGKRPPAGHDVQQAISDIPVRRRDRRRRGGGSQIVISTDDLGRLLIEILKAVDSPAPLRTLRQLALNRLSLSDPQLTSLDEMESAQSDREERGRRPRTLAVDARTPELYAIEEEQRREARRKAGEFLERIGTLVRHDPLRLDRLLQVTWHLYFDPEMPAQIEIARLVGLSDSSISDYRRRLELELGAVRIGLEEWPDFIESLEARLSQRLVRMPSHQVRSGPELALADWSASPGHQLRTSLPPAHSSPGWELATGRV
ncbi:MAG: hypothetical protein ACOYLF_06790 [Blastocatellia bacterium]